MWVASKDKKGEINTYFHSSMHKPPYVVITQESQALKEMGIKSNWH